MVNWLFLLQPSGVRQAYGIIIFFLMSNELVHDLGNFLVKGKFLQPTSQTLSMSHEGLLPFLIFFKKERCSCRREKLGTCRLKNQRNICSNLLKCFQVQVTFPSIISPYSFTAAWAGCCWRSSSSLYHSPWPSLTTTTRTALMSPPGGKSCTRTRDRHISIVFEHKCGRNYFILRNS